MTDKPCTHLEALLPKESQRSVYELTHKYAGNYVDRVIPNVSDSFAEKAKFINKISKYLSPIETDILTLKYVYNETFAAIAKELKLVGVETVIRLHDTALKVLKEQLRAKN